MMQNYNFINANYINRMSACEVARKIITNEEAYAKANPEQMPFEAKCLYALELTPIIHPAVSPDRSRRRALLEELHAELLLRADREDPFALYVLGNTNADLSTPATAEERRFLERSMQAGYVPAAISLLDRFYHGTKRSEPEAERIASWLSKHVASWLSEKVDAFERDKRRLCYVTVNGNTGNERALAIRLALDGDYCAMVRMSSNRNGFVAVGSNERDFWETVDFLVLEHFYDRGAKHLGDTVGMKLVNGRGCERDMKKICRIYTDLMLDYPYDRHLLLKMLDVPYDGEREDLREAERVCRKMIENGKSTGYWRMILLSLLSGDRRKLENACAEACEAYRGVLACNVSKAYHLLRQVKAS